MRTSNMRQSESFFHMANESLKHLFLSESVLAGLNLIITQSNGRYLSANPGAAERQIVEGFVCLL